MSRFVPLLKEINEKLDVPQPTKSRILLEIASDIDDLFNTYLEQGKSEKEAVALTEDMFKLDDAAITELADIHQPFFRNWMDKFASETQSRLEKASFVFVLLFIALFSGEAIVSSGFFKTASLFVYPILGIGFISLVIAIQRFYSLYIKKDHERSTRRNGLTSLVFLGVMNFFIGAWGYFIEIYSHGGGVALPAGSLINVVITVNPSQTQMSGLVDCFIKSATVVLSALFIASLIAILWFILVNKIYKIEQSEAEYLLTN
jgi:hypothetical protein